MATSLGNAGSGRDGSGGDYVFPNDVAMIVKNILNYSSSDSHTDEEKPYLIDEENKELFFGYLMQLCHVIKWFGKYADEHSNVEENRKKQKIVKVSSTDKGKERSKIKESGKKVKEIKIVSPSSAEDFKGRKYLISNDGVTLHCGSCKLDSSIPFKGGLVIIDEVIPNEGEDKDKYPFIVIKASKG